MEKSFRKMALEASHETQCRSVVVKLNSSSQRNVLLLKPSFEFNCLFINFIENEATYSRDFHVFHRMTFPKHSQLFNIHSTTFSEATNIFIANKSDRNNNICHVF